MLKRSIPFLLLALLGWLAWRWLHTRQAPAAVAYPHLAPQVATEMAALPPTEQPTTTAQPGYSAYCLTCHEQRTLANAALTTSANGRRAARGTCPVCGRKLFVFI